MGAQYHKENKVIGSPDNVHDLLRGVLMLSYYRKWHDLTGFKGSVVTDFLLPEDTCNLRDTCGNA